MHITSVTVLKVTQSARGGVVSFLTAEHGPLSVVGSRAMADLLGGDTRRSGLSLSYCRDWVAANAPGTPFKLVDCHVSGISLECFPCTKVVRMPLLSAEDS